MDRFKAWLGEGLILVPTVLLLGLILFTLTFRLGGLSNLAEILPDDTEAFFIVNMEDYAASGSPVNAASFTDFYGAKLDELDWFKGELAVAWINGTQVKFLKVKSNSEAQRYMETLVEGEELIVSEDIRCFEAQGICFRFVQDFVATSISPEALATLTGITPRLEDTSNYQNVRGRLGHLQSGFAFVNLSDAPTQIRAQLATQTGLQPLFLQSILQIFPAWGASVRMESTGWYAESFTAVNKDLLGGAYYRPTQKYEQKFLPWTKSFGWEWGTQDLTSQITRMQEIFAHMGSTGEMIFTSSLESAAADIFGPTTLAEALPLLGGETYFGWTNSDDFLFILELTEENRASAQTMRDRFVQNYTFKRLYTEDGEQKAELLHLTETSKDGYSLYSAGEQTVAAIFFTDDVLIIAPDEAALLAALDRSSGQSGRSLEEMSVLLPGSTEIWILDSAFLPEGNILRTHLSTLTRLMSTRKLFDDGIFTRTSLVR